MPNHVIVSTLGWSKATLEEALAGIASLEFGQADLALHEGWPTSLPPNWPARWPGARAAGEARGCAMRSNGSP